MAKDKLKSVLFNKRYGIMSKLAARKVFEITYVEIINSNSAKIGGRAYEKIHVGDILVTEINEKDILVSCKVLQIMLYDKSLEEIDELFTPWLFLETDNADFLVNQIFLYSQMPVDERDI